jgi:hypothetical protein
VVIVDADLMMRVLVSNTVRLIAVDARDIQEGRDVVKRELLWNL